MCARWGFERLTSKFHDDWSEEGHANEVVARILFLEGTPNMERYHRLEVGGTVRQMLDNDLRSSGVRSRFSRADPSGTRRRR